METLRKGICSQTEVALHTHDRISFRRCRRKWQFSSPFRYHLKPRADRIGTNPHLWFGSGIHFALEDFHGYNKFGDPVKAFQAYCDAFELEELPEGAAELLELGQGMLDYYKQWEPAHAKWKTVWLDGKPLVEQKFSLVLEEVPYEVDGKPVEVVYHGTFDRIVEDEQGDWWILDYKTAKSYDSSKLDLDTQISAYCWAAEQWYNRPIAGMIYLQMIKTVPKQPRITTKGVSTDKRQKTTRAIYKQALINYYGTVDKAPEAAISFLNDLAYEEDQFGDAFIKYDLVTRNEEAKLSAYRHIIDEGKEMTNKDLAIYPNPTRDCSWDCPFKSVCIAQEEGADWEYLLETDYEVRPETMQDEIPMWQKRLFRKNRELFPEEYKQYCQTGVDTFEDFMNEEY